MKVLVLGASGATGRLLVMQLAKRHIDTRIVVRDAAILSPEVLGNPQIEIKRGNISDFANSELARLLQGCDAIVSCLGHNISIKGMFGQPRNLVSDTMRNIAEVAGKSAGAKVRLVLMSTTAYTNTLTGEKNSPWESIIFPIIKLLLPPHRDNVRAADYLQERIGKHNEKVEWVAVRPDTLVNEDEESAYEVHQAPTRSPLFNAGTTSRINVSRFMADLLLDEALWREWLFKMPVVYNKGEDGIA